jgi:hypothetical protein
MTPPTPAAAASPYKIPQESLERWAEIVSDEVSNTQVMGQDPPTTDEGFLVLSIVVAGEHYGVKPFVVTHVLEEVVNRKRVRAEYFTTIEKTGQKVGVSIEWRTREYAWTNSTDKDLQEYNKIADAAYEAFQRKDGGMKV